MKKFTLITCLGMFYCLGFSQDKWEAGVLLGYSNYLGDLVEPTITFDQSSFAGGVLLRYHVDQNFGLRSNFVLGKVKGADANYESLAARGASFESDLIELSLVGEYEFFGQNRWDNEGRFKKIFSPYVFAGAGLAFTSSTIDLDTANRPSPTKSDDLNADFNETIQFALPVGIGVKMDVSRRLNVGLEWGWRLIFSDYLDGVSLAGNPDNDDLYIVGGMTVGFLLTDNDTDSDGIADKDDQCPEIPGLERFNGCPDSDNDGLIDSEDECPLEAGSSRFNGCPDTDQDGVPDSMDDCPDSPGIIRFSGCPDTDLDGIVDQEDNCPEVAGIVSMNGCPDSDRDGVEDSEDYCPTEKGSPAHKGCPDSDGDGLYDYEDFCPRIRGDRALKGCPDSDGDGVSDVNDECPSIPGSVRNNGCPVKEINAKDENTLNTAMQNVRFETASAILLPTSFVVLDEIVIIMNKYRGYDLEINGYTDNIGNDISNQQLSQQRAKACLDYLVGKGIDSQRLSASGFGEQRPIADNNTDAGRLLNRRVEFILIPK